MSYSKRNTKPYRIRQPKSKRLNFIMAVSSSGFIAFQARQGEQNIHSFISFMLDLYRKLQEMSPEYAENTIFYMDNLKVHTAEITQQMINMFKIPILFAPLAYYQINPIELVFSQVKLIVKKSTFTNMYLLINLIIHRDSLWNSLFKACRSINANIVSKCILHTFKYLEHCINEIDEIDEYLAEPMEIDNV